MKIFIDNYDLTNLNNVISTIKKYYIKKKLVMEISSEMGQYYIDDKGIYKLIYNDNKVKQVNNFYGHLNALFDYSYTEKSFVNQIPFKHLAMTTEFFYFAVNSCSKILLVIQFALTYKDNNLDLANDLVPIDFYFEINEINEIDEINGNNINNFFIKDELNVFFSLLTNI
jgi:hypothetical protein